MVKGIDRQDVRYRDLWGSRIDKYKALAEGRIDDMDAVVDCRSPMYFFSPHVPSDFSNWNQIWSVDDVFSYSSVGMLTARDRLTVAFSAPEAAARAAQFTSLPEDRARAEFDLGAYTRDWTVERAMADLPAVDLNRSARRVAYRPFDLRYAVYSG